jgi:hypothetical protein
LSRVRLSRRCDVLIVRAGEVKTRIRLGVSGSRERSPHSVCLYQPDRFGCGEVAGDRNCPASTRRAGRWPSSSRAASGRAVCSSGDIDSDSAARPRFATIAIRTVARLFTS